MDVNYSDQISTVNYKGIISKNCWACQRFAHKNMDLKTKIYRASLKLIIKEKGKIKGVVDICEDVHHPNNGSQFAWTRSNIEEEYSDIKNPELELRVFNTSKTLYNKNL